MLQLVAAGGNSATVFIGEQGFNRLMPAIGLRLSVREAPGDFLTAIEDGLGLCLSDGELLCLLSLNIRVQLPDFLAKLTPKDVKLGWRRSVGEEVLGWFGFGEQVMGR